MTADDPAENADTAPDADATNHAAEHSTADSNDDTADLTHVYDVGNAASPADAGPGDTWLTGRYDYVVLTYSEGGTPRLHDPRGETIATGTGITDYYVDGELRTSYGDRNAPNARTDFPIRGDGE
ncbi:hypothetical protein [Halobaculum sp. P14]|uniref:hypothetical protein n=1 Tax=Halobaculum sp. P14 TaxID=3421638 RepID=UPI003EBC1F24